MAELVESEPKVDTSAEWSRMLGPDVRREFKFDNPMLNALFERISNGYLDLDYPNTWWNVDVAVAAYDNLIKEGRPVDEALEQLKPIFSPRVSFVDYLKMRFPSEETQTFFHERSNLNWDQVYRNEELVGQYNEHVSNGTLTVQLARDFVASARDNIRNYDPRRWSDSLGFRF